MSVQVRFLDHSRKGKYNKTSQEDPTDQTNLVEREQELKTLEATLANTRLGKARFIVVEGGTGTGKSELIRFTQEQATHKRIPHLSTINYPANSDIPLGSILQLLQQPFFDELLDSDSVEEMTTLGVEISEIVQKGSNNPHLLLRLKQKIGCTLNRITRHTPLLITMEDIHNADSTSLHLLQQIIGEWRSGGLFVLLSQSLHTPPVDPRFHIETLRSPLYGHINLHPLSEEGVRESLRSHLGGVVADHFAHDYARATGGNPLLLRCLTEDAKLSGKAEKKLVPGREYQQSILAYLRTSSPHVRQIAEAVAVLSSSKRLEAATRPLLSFMFEKSDRSTDETLKTLEEMGILNCQHLFRLNAAKSVILDNMSSELYHELHIRAVHAMHMSGADKLRRSAVPKFFGKSPTGAWTADLLVNAASDDLVHDETENAITHLTLALNFCQREVERSRVTVKLARAKWRMDPLAATQHLNFLIESYYNDSLCVTDSVRLMHSLIWHGRQKEVTKMVRHFLRTNETQKKLNFLSEIQTLANIHPSLHRLFKEEQGFYDLGGGSASINLAARTAVSLQSLLCGEARTDPVNTAKQVLNASHPTDSTFDAIHSALLTLTYSGRLSEARRACEDLLDKTADRNASTWRAILSSCLGDIALRQGDLVTAENFARESLEILPLRSWGVAVGSPLGTLLMSAVRLGKLDEATVLLQYEVPEAMYESSYGLGYLLARGHYCLATGNITYALHNFRLCENLMRQWNMDFVSFHDWRSGMAEALTALGRPDEAKELISEQQDLLGSSDHRIRANGLVIKSRTEPLQERPEMLEHAIDLFRFAGDNHSSGRAMLELSRTYRSLGNAKRAHQLSERADRFMSKVDHQEQQAEDVADRQSETASSCLTKSELKVAELAVQGKSNREISRELFITISTVEQHLTQIYRKLNIKNRSALPAVFTDRDASRSRSTSEDQQRSSG